MLKIMTDLSTAKRKSNVLRHAIVSLWVNSSKGGCGLFLRTIPELPRLRSGATASAILSSIKPKINVLARPARTKIVMATYLIHTNKHESVKCRSNAEIHHQNTFSFVLSRENLTSCDAPAMIARVHVRERIMRNAEMLNK